MKFKFAPRAATLMLSIAGVLLPLAANAASWPEKPIRMVVPFPPGGNTDSVARIVSSALSEQLGQNVVVENLSGAGGTIGTNSVARAAPDGYTILMGTVGTQAINMGLYKNLSEESLKNFAPVTLITSIPNVLVVNKDLPVNSVEELVAYAKKSPHPLTFASSGIGTSIHLSGEMFKTTIQQPLTHIPYRGSAPAVTDLVGGQVNMMFDNLPPSLPFIQNGRLKALAVTSPKRNPLLPNVPTMIESGFPGFEIGTWNGIVAPAGTPPEVIKSLNNALQKVVASDDFKAKIHKLGGEVKSDGPEEFSAFINAEYKKWASVITAAGIEKQ